MKVVVNYVQWLVFVAFVCGALSYGMLSRSSIRKLRTALFYGIVTAVPVSFAMISAVFPVWLAVVSLLASIAVIVWNMMWWHKATLADRRSLRLRSAVCATGLNVFLFWPMTRAFDAFRRIPVVGVFQTQIAAIIAISAICFVWMTYFKRKRYRRRWTVTGIIWGILVTLAIISLLMSAVNAVPKSKSAKAKAAVETVDGQGPIDAIKELFGKLLGSSDEEVAPDDESVAAVAESDDESVVAVAESDDESVVAEVTEKSDEADAEAEAEESWEREPIVVDHVWSDYYNGAIQEDGINENDFNFGPDPGELNDYELDREFRLRLSHDPALGAASMAWVDAKTGMRTMGVFYDECSHNWAKAINVAKEKFIRDHSLYRQYLDNFFALLDSAKVSIAQVDGIVDQFYMNPFTIDGIPDVIVMLTKDHKGSILVYTFTIKDNQVPVGFRKDCGFQGCSWDKTETVAKVTKIQPVPEPERKADTPKPPTAGEITPVPKAPTPTPVPPTPTPVPGGGSDPEKDPSKTPEAQSESNNDSGKGDDTNSGKGSTKSAAASESQKASDSGSVQDYDRKVEQNRSANAGGGSSGGS